MFYINYLAMHKVQMYSNAIRNLLYGLCVSIGDNPFTKVHGIPSLYRRKRFVYILWINIIRLSIRISMFDIFHFLLLYHQRIEANQMAAAAVSSRAVILLLMLLMLLLLLLPLCVSVCFVILVYCCGCMCSFCYNNCRILSQYLTSKHIEALPLVALVAVHSKAMIMLLLYSVFDVVWVFMR